MCTFSRKNCITRINTLSPIWNCRHFADDIFKCIFLNEKFRLRFHWSLFLKFKLTLFQHWFRKWLGAYQETSHYLKQWWLVYWRIYTSLDLSEVIAYTFSTKTCLHTANILADDALETPDARASTRMLTQLAPELSRTPTAGRGQHIKPRTKWPIFRRRHFSYIFHVLLIAMSLNFAEVYS